MRPAENIDKLIKKLALKASTKLDKRVHSEISKALEKSERTKSAKLEPKIWRTIMKNKITKLAAAVIIITVVLSITFFNKSATPAYAIEQTIEANRGVDHLHFKYFAPSDSDVAVKECWVEFDKDSQPKNVRVNYYNWGGEDIVQVWKERKTQQWNKEQNTLNSYECDVFTAMILKFVRRYDPIQAVEHLYELRQKGKVEIEIEEPSQKTEPIIIKGTYLPGTYTLENPTLPAFRDVLFVDRDTKLVTAIEIYELKNGECIDRGVMKYDDYGLPFESNVFDLEEEVPDDVMRIVHYTVDDVNSLGIAQGALTDKEIAFVLVREFFKALIAEDYAKAGQLFGGMPAVEAQEEFGKLSIVRIVSINEPIQHDKPSSLRVPCKIEIEKDGEIMEWQPHGPFVRQVYRHAGRWRIIGGLDK